MEEDINDLKRLDEVLIQKDKTFLKEEIMYTSEEDDSEIEDDLYHTDLSDDDIDFSSAQSSIVGIKGLVNLATTKPYLSKEEYEVITSCPSPDLQKLMILNRAKYIKLSNVNVHYQNLLQRCVDILSTRDNETESCSLKMLDNMWLATLRLGYPYFKDKSQFYSPLSEEAINKSKRGELNPLYYLSSLRWTIDEQDIITRSVHIEYANYKTSKLKEEIEKIKHEILECKDDEKCKKLSEVLKQKMEDVKNVEHEIPPLDFKEINWIGISNELKDKHSPNSCEALWRYYLHPYVNKSVFSKSDNEKLKALVKQFHMENWEEIANKLGDNRSPYITCIHYFSKIYEHYSKGMFTPQEDKQLLDLVQKYQIRSYIPWRKIAYHFPKRSRDQCFYRYKYLGNGDVCYGSFKEAEDVLLYCLVQKFGKNFQEITKCMPNRSYLQVRHRYMYLFVNSGYWTLEEDKKIMEHAEKYGTNDWKRLSFLMNRREIEVRLRYNVLEKYLSDNVGSTLSDLRRQKHGVWSTRLKHKRTLLKRASNYFQDKIPTMKEIEDCLTKIKPNNHNFIEAEAQDYVDLELVDFFKGTCKAVPTFTKLSPERMKQNIEIIVDLLRVMGAKLTVPPIEELEDNVYLDSIDITILKSLKENEKFTDIICSNNQSNGGESMNFSTFIENQKKKMSQPSTITDLKPFINKVLPPNVSSVVGLRGLLIQHKKYNNKLLNTNEENKAIWEFERESLFPKNERERNEASQQYDLFWQRFNFLFKWPCILSSNKPHDIWRQRLKEKEKERLEAKQTVGMSRRANIKAMIEGKRRMILQRKMAENTASTSNVIDSNLCVSEAQEDHNNINIKEPEIKLNEVREKDKLEQEELTQIESKSIGESQKGEENTNTETNKNLSKNRGRKRKLQIESSSLQKQDLNVETKQEVTPRKRGRPRKNKTIESENLEKIESTNVEVIKFKSDNGSDNKSSERIESNIERKDTDNTERRKSERQMLKRKESESQKMKRETDPDWRSRKCYSPSPVRNSFDSFEEDEDSNTDQFEDSDEEWNKSKTISPSVKKKRGRQPKSSAKSEFGLGSAGEENEGNTGPMPVKRKRGRPPKIKESVDKKRGGDDEELKRNDDVIQRTDLVKSYSRSGKNVTRSYGGLNKDLNKNKNVKSDDTHLKTFGSKSNIALKKNDEKIGVISQKINEEVLFNKGERIPVYKRKVIQHDKQGLIKIDKSVPIKVKTYIVKPNTAMTPEEVVERFKKTLGQTSSNSSFIVKSVPQQFFKKFSGNVLNLNSDKKDEIKVNSNQSTPSASNTQNLGDVKSTSDDIKKVSVEKTIIVKSIDLKESKDLREVEEENLEKSGNSKETNDSNKFNEPSTDKNESNALNRFNDLNKPNTSNESGSLNEHENSNKFVLKKIISNESSVNTSNTLCISDISSTLKNRTPETNTKKPPKQMKIVFVKKIVTANKFPLNKDEQKDLKKLNQTEISDKTTLNQEEDKAVTNDLIEDPQKGKNEFDRKGKKLIEIPLEEDVIADNNDKSCEKNLKKDPEKSTEDVSSCGSSSRTIHLKNVMGSSIFSSNASTNDSIDSKASPALSPIKTNIIFSSKNTVLNTNNIPIKSTSKIPSNQNPNSSAKISSQKVVVLNDFLISSNSNVKNEAIVLNTPKTSSDATSRLPSEVSRNLGEIKKSCEQNKCVKILNSLPVLRDDGLVMSTDALLNSPGGNILQSQQNLLNEENSETEELN